MRDPERRGRILSDEESAKLQKENFDKLVPGILFEAHLTQDEADDESVPHKFFIACFKDEKGELEVIELSEDNKKRILWGESLRRQVKRLTPENMFINKIHF